MTLEVELKFPLPDSASVEALRLRLAERNAVPSEVLDQRDIYWAHPCRDFAQTDEVFRLRCVGEASFLTYKGPVLDELAKARREIEVPVASGAPAREQVIEMFRLLGFHEVRDVIKRREPFHVHWQDRDVEIVLDQVQGLGWFVELETLAADADREVARECLFALSCELNLGKSERRSYLRLLLEQDAGSEQL